MTIKRKIIFCQAPADVPYVLDLYEKTEIKDSISIFVINVEGVYTFISSLNLNLEKLVYIPYNLRNFKNIIYIFAERRRINKLWEKYFKNTDISDLYFFSRFEDWLTSAFIHRCSKNRTTNLYYVNHYDDSSILYPKSERTSLKLKIYLLLLKIITDVNFKVEIKEKLPELPIDHYTITELFIEDNPVVYLKYQYKFKNTVIGKPNLLFFISPCEKSIFNPYYYDNKLLEIIHLLKSHGFNIIFKGHPRLGIPKSLTEIIDFEIPTYVPGEFIDIKMVNLCFGLETKAICHYAKDTDIPSYSLIKLFPFNNKVLFDVAIQYLIQQSEGRIKFCSNFEDLEKLASIIKSPYDTKM